MADKKITFNVKDVSFDEAVSLAEREIENVSRFEVEMSGSKEQDSITFSSSMNNINVVRIGNRVEVDISGTERFVDEVHAAMKEAEDMALREKATRGSGPGDVRSNIEDIEDDTQSQDITRGEAMGGARPTELLPDDATLQATMRLYENGMVVVETGGETTLHETIAGVFFQDEGAGAIDPEVAFGYVGEKEVDMIDQSVIDQMCDELEDIMRRNTNG